MRPERRQRWERPGRPRKRRGGSPPLVGVAWYRQEQYERFLASAKDREQLEATWIGWKREAEAVLQGYRALGMEVRRVEVDLDELLAYCMIENTPNTAESRAAHVMEMLQRQEDGPSGPPSENPQKGRV